ncbi:MAG: hypothetical protein HY033_09045 [Ignavibacteriae bacterium]|nr:hypothetical protein [Ignavibacteria bacterium]MBI3365037.1 hypothetical protein [Ignavibacteriota bacterium]
MIASIALSLDGTSTTGYSSSAAFIIQEQLKNSYYFSVLKKVLPELIEVRDMAIEKGWDGYGADAIQAETFARAYAFLEVLPTIIPAPTVGAEPDGHITFEWYQSPNRVLSVSISPEGDLHYAALIGPNKAYGTEIFLGETPRIILDLIRRINAT